MNISHIVVAGCSFTYCQGLENPKEQGWPGLLSKALNVPVVNLAQPGLGNDAIHRRTYEYAFEDNPDNSPLYIVAWTQTWRREAWCRTVYSPDLYPGYNIVSFPENKPSNNVERALLDTWSEEDFYRRLNLYRLSLDSLFKSRNIKYYSTFFAEEEFNGGSYTCQEIISNVKSRFNNTTRYLLNNSNRLRSFYEMAGPYPKTQCGHEGLEGNKVIADYLIKVIGEVTVDDKPFLSLKEYQNKTDPHHTRFTDWF